MSWPDDTPTGCCVTPVNWTSAAKRNRPFIFTVSEVTDEVLDAAGYVIHHELDLPVCVSMDPVPLPPHTRVRGLATGPQWDQASLVRAFTNATSFFPRGPIKYVLITPVDIYMEEANYVYSTTYP